MQSPRGFFLPSFKEYKGFKEETKWHLIDKTYWWVCKNKIQGHDTMEFQAKKLNFFTNIVHCKCLQVFPTMSMEKGSKNHKETLYPQRLCML